jgi:hypothetical protein
MFKRLLLATTFLAGSIVHVLPTMAFVGGSAPTLSTAAASSQPFLLIQTKGQKGSSTDNGDDDDQGEDDDDQGEDDDDQGEDDDDQGEDDDDQGDDEQ